MTDGFDYRRIAEDAVAERGAMQKPLELARMLAVLADVSPFASVLEIGGMLGGTAWAWRQVADRRGAGTVIVTVDSLVLGGRMQYAGAHVLIAGDSHEPGTLKRVRKLVPLVDFLFIDGDHSYDGVRKDFAMFAPLVRPGGVIALHDVSVEQPAEVRGIHDEIPFWNQIRPAYRHEEVFVAYPELGDRDWGGIGVLHVESQDAAGIEAALGEPTDAERVGTVMLCARCGGHVRGLAECERCE